jgi:hypothetical protein
MNEQDDQGQAPAAEGAATTPNLQGNIYMTTNGGTLASYQLGTSPASVDWTQGSAPVANAQFILAHAPRSPIPPQPPMVTNLKPGENSIPFWGDWYSASVSWTYDGESGAATFSSNMGGLPLGPTGWNIISAIASPRQGNFQIAFASEPTSCLLSLAVTPAEAFMGPQLVLVYVDGTYVGALGNGTQVVINGKVVSLAVDFRAESYSDLDVGYTLQYQW